MRAWLAGLAILVGITLVCADVAYMVTWPTTHVGGGFDISLMVDDYFNGELTIVEPVAAIVLGEVNRITLKDLTIGNVTDLAFVLTDYANHTLLAVTHPDQVDLQNHSLTCWTDVRFSSHNVTLRIVRGTENTSFTLRIIGEKVTPRALITYLYPLVPIVGGFIVGFSLIGWGFYVLQYIAKTAWD